MRPSVKDEDERGYLESFKILGLKLMSVEAGPPYVKNVDIAKNIFLNSAFFYLFNVSYMFKLSVFRTWWNVSEIGNVLKLQAQLLRKRAEICNLPLKAIQVFIFIT